MTKAINDRLSRLEAQAGKAQRLGWREFINLDGEAWEQACKDYPGLLEDWRAFLEGHNENHLSD